ncbi:ATP-binding cassette domain-containing protein [Ignavigranum ruoffiae]|uniref:ATP-binding cassette domain-containing protein n=1 Tax=Ignavigranum ruoffiae TaxID=89093 RepID=UPI0024ADA07C|nr:ATP-binding cassette domain-containing protein [Ignavigranum ruoffiae]
MGLSITNIQHQYSHFELDVENLNLCENKVYGLIGRNGAGKTTFMDTLSGHIVANKKFKISNLSHDDILYIPSTSRPYTFLTVNEFSNLVIKYAGTESNSYEILNRLGLFEKKDERISNLSEGMIKKLSLIQLFIKPYPLILLDEPFNSIDIQYSYEIKKIINTLKSSSTIMVSSHIIDSLIDLCDEFILMESGKIKKRFINNQDKKEIEGEIFD